MSELDYNFISIKPRFITMFFRSPVKKIKLDSYTPSLANLDDNRNFGIISSPAAKKIKTAIDWLLTISEDKKYKGYRNGKYFNFLVNFVTLTLPSPQVHNDNDIKKQCLNQFLVEARKKWGVGHYVWRAESQKNGNIHFHITTNKFIPHTELRDNWNRIINKLGYVDRYRQNMQEWHKDGFKVREDLLPKWSKEAQKKAYKKGINIGWSSPNSTDIHSVKHVNNLADYLSKYCTKNEIDKANAVSLDPGYTPFSLSDNGKEYIDNKIKGVETRPITGRLWGLSTSLSKIRSCVIELEGDLLQQATVFNEKFKGKVFDGAYFKCFIIPIHEAREAFGEFFNWIIDDFIDFCVCPSPT